MQLLIKKSLTFEFDFVGFFGNGLGFCKKEDLVWYLLFTIFVPYAMLPLPLRWCMIAGCMSSVGHILLIAIKIYVDSNKSNEVSCYYIKIN